MEPRIANRPTATGSAAATTPPNTHNRMIRLTGTAIISRTTMSFRDCSTICTLAIASPPALTVTPSTWGSAATTCRACSWALVSPPPIPAITRPVLPSLLISAVIAAAGTVHAEVTVVTYGECSSIAVSRPPAVLAAGLSTPPSACTARISRMSPAANLSVSTWEAEDDSEVGSWKPPVDRLLLTGIPTTAAAIMNSTAAARMRRGRVIANLAIASSIVAPFGLAPTNTGTLWAARRRTTSMWLPYRLPHRRRGT